MRGKRRSRDIQLLRDSSQALRKQGDTHSADALDEVTLDLAAEELRLELADNDPRAVHTPTKAPSTASPADLNKRPDDAKDSGSDNASK